MEPTKQNESGEAGRHPLRGAKRGKRGGPRPGSGPPKGNLNALKHGRYSAVTSSSSSPSSRSPRAVRPSSISATAIASAFAKRRSRHHTSSCAGSPTTTRRACWTPWTAPPPRYNQKTTNLRTTN